MKNLETIKQMAEKLPKNVQANALALLDLMGSAIEGIGDDPVEWKPELAKIIQATSDRSKLPRGAAIGSILVGEKVLDQPVKLIPIRMWNGRQYWSPDQNEAKILCSSPDAKIGYIGYTCSECPHSQWNKEENKSACNKIKQVAVITSDLSQLFILNFAKTNYTNGVEWESMMKKAGVQTFKRQYEIKTETHKQYKNVETIAITASTEKTPEEYIDFLQAIFDRFSEDRTAFLETFHKMAQDRAQTHKSLIYQNEVAGELPETISTAEGTPSEGQTSLASKYSM